MTSSLVTRPVTVIKKFRMLLIAYLGTSRVENVVYHAEKLTITPYSPVHQTEVTVLTFILVHLH